MGRGGVFATLYRPGVRYAHQRQESSSLHRGQAGEKTRRQSLVEDEPRRHSLGLLMTRPSEGEGRELPTILESPGLKPSVGCDQEALYISPSRSLSDLESSLKNLENQGKPLEDFDSALDSYKEGLATMSSQSSMGSGSLNFVLDYGRSISAENCEAKLRPVSMAAAVEGNLCGQYKTEKYFDQFETRFDRLESRKNIGAGKYFDNLVTMIEGSMRGLEL